MRAARDIKRVGESGQLTVGRRFAGQLFEEEVHDDGVIVLRPVEVLPKDHWLVRDAGDIRRAVAWAKKNKPNATDLAAFTKRVKGGR